ncbi:MAG: hypothetical protein VX438_04890, partial [Planctomycetota bacterium]|nr:hypothetical protein [Planctomycetota bacterium]
KPKWETDEDYKLNLEITATYSKTKANTFSVEVNNTGTTDYTPKLGEFQIFLQTNLKNRNSAIRCFPDQDSPLYQTNFKANTKVRFEIDWNNLIENGLWTSANLLAVKMNGMKAIPAENRIGAKIKLGPAMSAHFEVPKLPTLKPKPFR